LLFGISDLRSTPRSHFLCRQGRSQEKQGYEIACIREAREVVAAAGYRELELLAWGRVFYVDDLVTAPARLRQGFCLFRSQLSDLKHCFRQVGAYRIGRGRSNSLLSSRNSSGKSP